MDPLDPKLVLEYVRDLKEFLESSNIFERRAFLGYFIESIEADDGEITFNYTLPLPPDNSRQETVSVLGIVPTGPPKKIFPHRVIYVFFELAITSSLESKAALSAYPRLLV